MLKLTSTLTIIIALSGCKQVTLNTASNKYIICENEIDKDVGIRFNDGVYECVYPQGSTKRDKRTTPIQKHTEVSKGCPTTVTEIFNSKEFKKPLVVCKGKFLTGSQVTRKVYVNK
jgi:hypothetical protein